MDTSIFSHAPERGQAPVFASREEPAAAKGREDEEEFSFWDLLDVVNPLQHIPVISTLYRHITGDEIRAPAQLAGGFLYGGAIGLASSAVNVGVEEATGNDIGGHVMAFLDPSTPEAGGEAGAFQAASQAYGRATSVGLGPGSVFDGFDAGV